MVLTSPLSVMAAEEDVAVSSEGDDLGDGSEITDPGTDTPTPDPGTDTPTPDPGTDTPTPDPDPIDPTPTNPDTPTPNPDTPTPNPDTPTPNPDTPTPNPDTPTPDPIFDDGSKSAAVQTLIDGINALAGQTLTLDQAAKVQELRAIYNSISADQKKLVTNYNLLVGFESKIAELQKKQNADTSALTDGSKASETGKTGTPVYYVSNLQDRKSVV